MVSPAVTQKAVTPAASALSDILAFGPAVKVGTNGNEPVVRVGSDGTVYVAALQYVYVSRDDGATFSPVAAEGSTPIYASDSALAVSPAGRAYVVFDWPYAGQTAVCSSADRGATWSCDPLVVPGATDRMWIAAPTANDVYVITGETLDRPTFAVSHDQGKTWKVTYFDPMTGVQGADLAWDPIRHLVVEAASDPNASGSWGIRSWKSDGTYGGFEKETIASPEPTVAVDAAGTWWATACANETGPCAPAVAMSRDTGKTWNLTPLPFSGHSLLMPFVAAGAANRVALAWYETNATSASDASAEWRVVGAQTLDGKTWTPFLLTPTPVHTGAMCRAVTCLGDARFAGDFLGLAFGPQGNLHVTWMRQTAQKLPPTTQLQAQPWDEVQYARTLRAALAPATATPSDNPSPPWPSAPGPAGAIGKGIRALPALPGLPPQTGP
jgi:hypothetical protein